MPIPPDHAGLLLADLLIAHGVHHVFGLPGGQTAALYDGILQRRPAIQHVLLRDERSAGYAAHAYARLTGRVGVCDATVGPGAAKLPSALGEALNSSVPVLAVVSELPSAWALHRRRGAASQALDQVTLLRPVTKWLAEVPDVRSLPGLVAQAFREATTGRPGPVALLVPQDVFDAPASAGSHVVASEPRYGRFPALRTAPDPVDIAPAADILCAAERPVLVLGGGVLTAGAGDAAGALADLIGAAITTSLSGKGAVSEAHPLHAGVVGSIGTPAARRLLEDADLAVLVGTKVGSNPSFGWTLPRRDQHVVQLDVDPGELGRAAHVDAPLLADARLGLEALLAAVDDRCTAPGGSPGWCGRIRDEVAAWRAKRDAERASARTPIAPQRVMGELDTLLGPTDIVVCDASLASGWGGLYLEQVQPGRRFLFPRGLAGLGYAVPAAVGASFARPGTRVVALAGDGALGYAVGELATVVQHRLPVTLVLLDNSSLGWIRWYRRMMFGRGHEEPDFAPIDYAAVARAYGWTGVRVDDTADLPGALAGALGGDGPTLVHVVTEVWETPIFAHRAAVGAGTAAAVDYSGASHGTGASVTDTASRSGHERAAEAGGGRPL